jgi:hypothetical protein
LVFGCVASIACLLLAWPCARRAALAVFVVCGAAFAVFTLFIYLPSLAPHYGQRELFERYYAERRSEREPVVAYQMNWKGENFYTGNRIPAFVSSGAKFEKWLERKRRSGTRVIFFVLQHERLGALKSELGSYRRVDALTDRQLNNKFLLVRAEL